MRVRRLLACLALGTGLLGVGLALQAHDIAIYINGFLPLSGVLVVVGVLAIVAGLWGGAYLRASLRPYSRTSGDSG